MAGTLPMNLTTFGSLDGAWVKVPSTPSMTGCERDVARDSVAALVVQFADGGADLVVGVAGDVLHQEVDQPRIALQDAEKLQGAVGGLGDGRRRASGRRQARARLSRVRFSPSWSPATARRETTG